MCTCNFIYCKTARTFDLRPPACIGDPALLETQLLYETHFVLAVLRYVVLNACHRPMVLLCGLLAICYVMYRSLYVQPVMICLQTDMPLAVLTNNVVAVVCNHPWGLTQPGHPCLGEG